MPKYTKWFAITPSDTVEYGTSANPGIDALYFAGGNASGVIVLEDVNGNQMTVEAVTSAVVTVFPFAPRKVLATGTTFSGTTLYGLRE